MTELAERVRGRLGSSSPIVYIPYAEAYDADSTRTSARTGAGVEEAFQRLGSVVARRQLEGVVGEEE